MGTALALLHRSYLSKRLLRLQVGFLLSDGPGASRVFPLDFQQRLQIDDELFVESLCGKITLTRAKDGILLQGQLRASQLRDCDRCLDAFAHDYDLEMAELYAMPGQASKSDFHIDGNGEIDLAPLLREEALIEASYRAICSDDCRGLSAETGDKLGADANANASGMERAADAIDPRMAVLKKLLA